MKQKRQGYVIPMVEVLSARVEKGFLISTPQDNPNPATPDPRRLAGGVVNGGESGAMFN